MYVSNVQFQKKSIPSPLKVIGNSEGEGVLKVKILETMYAEAKLEFPGGWGRQNKTPSVGGVWIFSGTVKFISNH